MKLMIVLIVHALALITVCSMLVGADFDKEVQAHE